MISFNLKKEGEDITNKVLSNWFGYSADSLGGHDSKLFVLNYRAQAVNKNADVLFKLIQADLNCLLDKH